MFPEDLYLDAVKEAYGKSVSFIEEEKNIPGITGRVEKAFERLKYGEFEKWRPANVIIDWIQKDSDERKIPQKTCKYFESIFTNANKLLKKS